MSTVAAYLAWVIYGSAIYNMSFTGCIFNESSNNRMRDLTSMDLFSILTKMLKDKLRLYWVAVNRWHSDFSDCLKLASLYIKIYKKKFIRLFFAAPIPIEAGGRLNLHLGCGAINHEKFINIDGYPYPHVHYVQNIDKLTQFKSDSVDLIYASHCLEHFSYLQTKSVLQEWGRVLKKGGILRLSVPDFDKLIDIYIENKRDPDMIIEQLMGGQNNRYNFHLTALNKVNLTRLLKSTGFSEIREWKPGTNDLTTFDDFSIYKKKIENKKYEISLNIEALKVSSK